MYQSVAFAAFPLSLFTITGPKVNPFAADPGDLDVSLIVIVGEVPTKVPVVLLPYIHNKCFYTFSQEIFFKFYCKCSSVICNTKSLKGNGGDVAPKLSKSSWFTSPDTSLITA